MKYTIYQITNKINGKIYVGKHQTENIDDGYFGSGVALCKAIKKHGKENFIKEILFIFDNSKDMDQKEKEIINESFVNRNDTYNMGVGGEGGPHFKGKTHSKETIEKIQSHPNRILAKEKLKGRIPWNKGKKQTPEHNLNISKAKKGTSLSEETKQKIKESRKKQIISDETRLKMSESAKRRHNKTS